MIEIIREFLSIRKRYLYRQFVDCPVEDPYVLWNMAEFPGKPNRIEVLLPHIHVGKPKRKLTEEASLSGVGDAQVQVVMYELLF